MGVQQAAEAGLLHHMVLGDLRFEHAAQDFA